MIIRTVNNPIDKNDFHLDLNLHIHQRLETFIYKREVFDLDIPLTYIDNKDIQADYNTVVVDKSNFLPENNIVKTFHINDYIITNNSSFTTVYPSVLITHKATIDSKGNIFPLFFGEALPENTTEVKFEQATLTGNIEIKNGFVLSDDKRRVYYSFNNSYNELTNEYELYYITVTTTDGIISKGLINPTSAIKEVEWTDTDSEGEVSSSVPVYYKENNGSDYTYYFNESHTYYIKTEFSSYINPLKFPLNSASDGWFPNFSTGEFVHVDDLGTSHSYKIREAVDVSYIPYSPWRFDSYASYERVNKNVIFIGRKKTGINSTDRVIKIIVRNSFDEILYAFTTQTSLEGTKYKDDVDWSTDEISSWDNYNGLIELNIEIQPSWKLDISYYYEQKSYSLNSVNLNPLYNNKVYTHYYVVYLKPDIVTGSALHYLLVRNDGIIVDTSDSDFKLLNSDGSYNSNTFIGLTYRGNSTDPYSVYDWVTLYSVESTNIYQFLILAEYFFIERLSYRDIESINVNREGDVLKDSVKEYVAYRNHRLFHSKYLATENGYEYSKNNTLIYRLSYSLLEEYGGSFTLDLIEQQLYKYLGASKLILFEWDEDIREISIDNSQPDLIQLIWNYIGSGYTYKIYRSLVKDSGFELIDSIASDYKSLSYIDSTVDSNKIYYYYIVPSKNDIDFPQSITIGAKVR